MWCDALLGEWSHGTIQWFGNHRKSIFVWFDWFLFGLLIPKFSDATPATSYAPTLTPLICSFCLSPSLLLIPHCFYVLPFHV
jgi:hypothetical protein